MSNMQGISYIVPAYNEEDGIHDTIDRLRNTLMVPSIPYSVNLHDFYCLYSGYGPGSFQNDL